MHKKQHCILSSSYLGIRFQCVFKIQIKFCKLRLHKKCRVCGQFGRTKIADTLYWNSVKLKCITTWGRECCFFGPSNWHASFVQIIKKGSIHSIRTSKIIKWRKKLKCTGLKFVGISLLLYPPQTMTGKNGTGNCGNRNFFLEILKAVPTDLTNSRNDGPHLKNVLEWAMKSLLYFITAWNLVGRS